MAKYYEVEAVNKILEDLFNEPAYQHEYENFYVGVDTVKQALLSLSTVELDPNKKGKWSKEDSKYCPHCNTPMGIGGAIT